MKNQFSYQFYLSIIWLACIILVNPIGDFPLNDDWSYGLSAQSMAVDHQLYFDDWGAMTLIAHTVWGAFFCKIFGFSFTVLRVSVLLLSWMGLLTLFAFFKEGGLDKKLAFWATILIAFNPLYFSLSFTYMTDIPFLFFTILSAYFFLKTINQKGAVNLIFATIFSIIASLIRQPGVLIPIAFFGIFIIKNKPTLSFVFQSVMPATLTFASLFSFIHWREKNYGLSDAFGTTDVLINNIKNGKIISALHEYSYGIFMYWGFFLIPILILIFGYFLNKNEWKVKSFASFFTIILIWFFWGNWNEPQHGNIITNFGIGPRLYSGFSYEGTNSPIALSSWHILKMIGFFAGAILFFMLLFRALQNLIFLIKRKTEDLNWATVFSLATVFIYFSFLMSNSHYFDRYYLQMMPFLLLAILPKNNTFTFSKWSKIFAAFAFSFFVFFSVGATKDYLSWSRTKWKALNYLTDDLKISPEHINGGVEFNGWNKIGTPDPRGWNSFDFWKNGQEKFRLAKSDLCGFETIKIYPSKTFFPPSTDSVFVLKKLKVRNYETFFCDAELLNSDSSAFLSNLENYTFGNVDTRNKEKVYRGEYSIKLDNKKSFGFSINLKNVEPCERIWVSLMRNPSLSTAAIVVSAADLNNYYENGSTKILFTDENGWGKLMHEFVVPENYPENSISIYLFHPADYPTWIDDLEITRMKMSK